MVKTSPVTKREIVLTWIRETEPGTVGHEFRGAVRPGQVSAFSRHRGKDVSNGEHVTQQPRQQH